MALPGWMVTIALKIEACASSLSLSYVSGDAVEALGAAEGFAVTSVLNMLPSSASDMTIKFFMPILNSPSMPVTLQT